MGPRGMVRGVQQRRAILRKTLPRLRTLVRSWSARWTMVSWSVGTRSWGATPSRKPCHPAVLFRRQ